jgi:hypothetical protein
VEKCDFLALEGEKGTSSLHREMERPSKKVAWGEGKISYISVSVNFIDEVELDVLPLDVCRVVFGSPYMYIRDEIFIQISNQYQLIKDGKSYNINAHKGKSKISLVSANQAKKFITSSNNYVFLLSR